MANSVMALDWRLRERRAAPRGAGWQTSGGVVLDADTGRLLLVKNRRERGEGRSGWTWPKGRIDPGEGPVFAALREINEEAGVLAEPLGRILTLETARALRHYFLFSKISSGLPFHAETLSVSWVSAKRAARMLQRERDHQVLRAARRAMRELQRGTLGGW